MTKDNMITISKSDLEDLQIKAAKEGARQALASLGLDDPNAIHDIKDLRDLITAYRYTRTLIWQTIIKYLTAVFLGAIAFGVFTKYSGGGQ